MKLENQSWKVGGLQLEHPIMNAAGVCKHLDGDMGVQLLARSTLSAIVVGSITKKAREGNTGGTPYFSRHDRWSVNSLGMPNRGLDYYRVHVPLMRYETAKRNKPLIISVAGDNKDEYVELAHAMLEAGADGVELNFGCPNVIEKGKHEPIISFDHGLVFDILLAIKQELGTDGRIGVKLSPYSDPQLLRKIAGVINDSEVVRWVTTSNTFPKATDYEDGRLALGVADGYGGFAGPGYKPIALGQVRQFRKYLSPNIDIIGVGGITSADDVRDFLRAGAAVVQMATALLPNNLGLVGAILSDLTDPIV